MRGSIDPGRPSRGRIATIGVAALLAAASLVPAGAAQAAGTTTVHGTVQSGSTRLSGVTVGFWSRTGRRLAGATTGASGSFTLHVPSGVRGFAYAGARPDGTRAIFTVGGTSYVRGVIGATQGSTISFPLYQGHGSATAANLAGGTTLHFRLQKPGRVRVDGGKYLNDPAVGWGAVELLRLNGGQADLLSDSGSAGVFTSKLVVPGAYRVRLSPVGPYLGRTAAVTVRPGATTSLRPSFVKGATVSGTITSGGKPAAGVRVLAVTGGSVRQHDVTNADGHYALKVLPTGNYQLRIGYNLQPDPTEIDSGTVVPPATSDDYLPVIRNVSVTAAHAPVRVDAALRPAGHVTGTIRGLTGEFRWAWLEDGSRRIVRTASVSEQGKVAFGGLVPGRTYTVYSANDDGPKVDSRYGKATFTATSGTVSTSFALNTRTLTLRGVASGAAHGSVTVRAQGAALPLFGRGGKVDATGSYIVRGLLPAAYVTVVSTADLRVRLTSRPQALTLTASTTKNLAAGPRPGIYRARFVSGAAPIATGNSSLTSAVSAAGDQTYLYSGADGRVRNDTMRPGVYRYQPPVDAVPAIDGPWWFGVPTSGFTITAGRTTNVGTIALHVRAAQ